MAMQKINISPAFKISIGLISLIMTWAILLELFIGFWPDQTELHKDLRTQISKNLAIQSTQHLQNGNILLLNEVLQEASQLNTSINSIAIRKVNGQIIFQTNNHQRYWKPISESESTLDFIRVGVNTNDQQWGSLEIAFKPISPKTFIGWISQPHILSLLLLVIGGLVFYSFYLRKTFVHLDPSSVIPDRVSVAFDSFSEGVMMVDKNGRIVLANKTLTEWAEDDHLFGKLGKDIAWLKQSLREDASNYPWIKSMETQTAINGVQIEFQKKDGEVNKAILNCSPILDATNKIRGCIITFDNVTELDKVNRELTSTMDKLYKSQNEIESQNLELKKLASRDPLTNCLNRRAFFEAADKIFKKSIEENLSLSCIMADIDHFKRFNDKFGHALGDKVIIAFSRTLGRSLRIDDLLTRYGGEEFCILLPDTSIETVLEIAERIRLEVELHTGQTIRSTEEITVTSSFGIATLSSTTPDLSVLIDHADQALYKAKNNGRNCVKFWQD